MAVVIIAMNMRRIMTSLQPALIFVSVSFRLITVTERKTKTISIIMTSRKTVTAGFIWFIAPTGLVVMTSGEDHAQKANPKTIKTAVRRTVIIVERIVSLLSGISSLTVLHTDLEPEDLRFTLKHTDRFNIVYVFYDNWERSMMMIVLTILTNR